MRYLFLIFVGVIAFCSCSKDKDDLKPVDPKKEIIVVPWTDITPATIIVSKETMPLISDDRKDVKRHLKTFASKVLYTKKEGVWIIEAKLSLEESKIFSSIRYEIISEKNELENFNLTYEFKEHITDETKERVYQFISENSKIIL
ncbi:MAG: hypothetical protein WBG43_06855 [Marinifilaceae bacterium]